MLKIVQGGRLLKKDDEGNVLDVTNHAYSFLFTACDIEDGVTLKDVFTLINRHIHIFEAVFSNYCREIVAEGLSEPDAVIGKEDSEEIEHLELYWDVGLDNSENKDSLYGLNFLGFHGMSPLAKEDIYDREKVLMCKKDDRVRYSVMLTPSYELSKYPLKVNKKFFAKNDFDTSLKVVEITEVNPTLGQILMGIIYELSWHGAPKDRDDFANSLRAQIWDLKE